MWRPDLGGASRRLAAALLLALAAGGALVGSVPPPASAEDRVTLRLAVVGFYNPRLMYVKYQPLVDYLSQHTPWRFELDLSSSYRQTVARLCAGQVQVGYLGPFTYLRAHEECGIRPVVRLNTRGEATYRAHILVREDSPIRTLADLRGKSFGYGAILSTSSHLMPRHMLLGAGLKPGVDVFCRYYQHHERAARAVLLGEVSACGIRDLVGDQFKGRGLRVIARSEPMANFPLALAPRTPDGLEQALVRALVDLPRRDPVIAREIAGWDAELSGGFAPITRAAYEPLRNLAFEVFGPNALTVSADLIACPGGTVR